MRCQHAIDLSIYLSIQCISTQSHSHICSLVHSLTHFPNFPHFYFSLTSFTLLTFISAHSQPTLTLPQFVALETLPTSPNDDDEQGKMYFVTAGADGYMRWWDYETMDEAEVEEGAHFEMEPLAELLVGDGVKISSMLRGDDHWIALDANGAIWKVYD